MTIRNIERFAIFLLLLIFTINETIGQQKIPEFITFKSDFEKQVLTDPDRHQDIELLIAISENASSEFSQGIQAQIQAFKRELVAKNFEGKSEEKKVKLLFSLMHKNFFQKYRQVSNFDQIFKLNEYNCVSATALYALILKAYNIPFSIKETPTHVYSIAYPQTKSIVLESTAPKDGYHYLDDHTVQKAVGSLVELKYFTQDEVDTKGSRKIYNEFFFNEDEIDLRKLAGLQYHNEAVTFFVEEKYKEALNSNYKATLLYPSEKSEYLNLGILANILSKTEISTTEDVLYLTQYANLPAVDKNQLLDSYRSIVNSRLFEESRVDFTDSMYQYLAKNLKDSILLKNISEIHYEAFGRFYGQKSEFKKSLEFLSEAYKLNDKNANIQSLITHCLIQNFSRRAGSLGAIKKMDEYSKQFEFLKDNILYQSLYFFNYGYTGYNHLRADDMKKGMENLDLMESLIVKFGENLQIDENLYGLLYAEAGAAYFREREYQKAKKIIEKGLDILPDHPELKIRLEIVIDEMN